MTNQSPNPESLYADQLRLSPVGVAAFQEFEYPKNHRGAYLAEAAMLATLAAEQAMAGLAMNQTVGGRQEVAPQPGYWLGPEPQTGLQYAAQQAIGSSMNPIIPREPGLS